MSGWFGESWGAPVCGPDSHMPTPVGAECPYCEQPIVADDQGMTVGQPATDLPLHYHRLCLTISVIPCGMWDAEMHEHAQRIGYQHSDACDLPKGVKP